jgi:hypothetical protein
MGACIARPSLLPGVSGQTGGFPATFEYPPSAFAVKGMRADADRPVRAVAHQLGLLHGVRLALQVDRQFATSCARPARRRADNIAPAIAYSTSSAR